MKISEIISLVEGEVMCGASQVGDQMQYAFASDLMSDVLTLKNTNFMLITGLANVQTIRTAEMSDVKCILLVRGKQATEEMVELAEDNGMVLVRSPYSMFKVAGILYGAGLQPVY